MHYGLRMRIRHTSFDLDLSERKCHKYGCRYNIKNCRDRNTRFDLGADTLKIRTRRTSSYGYLGGTHRSTYDDNQRIFIIGIAYTLGIRILTVLSYGYN